MGLTFEHQAGLSEVFPNETPTDVGFYLNGIPQDSVLIVISSFLSKKKINGLRLKEFIEHWFRPTNIDFANEAYQQLLKVESKIRKPTSIVTRTSALKLFSYANNKLDNKKTQTDEDIEINLFKAFLYENELINKTEDKISETTKDLNANVRLYALQFSNIVRFSDVVNYNLGDIFISEFIRAILFFEFLEKRNDTKSLLEKFIEKYEVFDWKDYLKRIMSISHSIFKKIKDGKDGHLYLTITKDDSYERNIKFLDTLSAIKYDELTDHDFKILRERPLHKIEEGKYLIISELFSIERIFKGLYFNLKAINDGLVKDFRFLYTYEFSEKYVLYEILKKTFPKRYVSFTGEELKNKRIEGAPDYYVRNNNKLFIFESKDSLINASLKESGDFSLLEKDIKKKFYIDKDDSKAIMQLLNFTKTIYTKDFHKIDSGYKIETLRVFPIIIIHDRQLDVAGFNKILNYWFSNEIEKVSNQIPVDKISPITVIDMSTLILIHELLINRQLTIEGIIVSYHDFVKVKRPENFNSRVQYEKHLMDTGLPFSYFVKELTNKKKLPKLPKRMLDEKGKSIFEITE